MPDSWAEKAEIWKGQYRNFEFRRALSLHKYRSGSNVSVVWKRRLGDVSDQWLLVGCPVPRHERVPEGGGPSASDLLDDIGNVSLRLGAVELCRLDDRIDDGGALPRHHSRCCTSSEIAKMLFTSGRLSASDIVCPARKEPTVRYIA